jgi:Tfp pilus assembly protein PilN
MANINFVPDDYVQNSESRRTNLMYLILFSAVMVGLVASFASIKMRQKSLVRTEKAVNQRLTRAQEAIKQFEELQARRKAMLKTALMTSKLIEPVNKSVLLASLTNNLPSGTSLLNVTLVQKKIKAPPKPRTKYDASKAKVAQAEVAEISPEELRQTDISIEGVAPSDLQVAACIEHLNSSTLLDNVALVESKQYSLNDTVWRRFKLTATLAGDVHLTKDDIESIRGGYSRTAFY